MNFKKIFFIGAFVFCYNLPAQHMISGKIVNSQNVGMPFVNVVLLNPDNSSLNKGATTNDSGFFQILDAKEGDYILTISFLGFKTISKAISIMKPEDLGAITIVEELESLDEVTIVGKKKLIQRKIDRLVFNVENSSKASQGDALELLKVTPGVRVQNESISMIGKNTVSVMVDDKIIRLSGEDLSSFLKSIASEDIKSIEVITTPPAKYEASGNSGLVNIQLKKAKLDSWNALIRTGYWQRTNPNGSVGANFNYNKNKFSVASSIFYRDGNYHQEQDDYAYFSDGIWYTKSPFKANIMGMNARVDLNYQISDNWSIGGQYLFNRTEYKVTDNPYTPVFDNNTNEIIRSLQSQGTMNLSPAIHAINFNNIIKLDTIGKKIAINVDYFSYDNPDKKTYSGTSIINEPFNEQYYSGINVNSQNVDNISGTIDVDYPTKWAAISFGGKVTRSESANNITMFNSGLVNQPITNFPLERNDFNYLETIKALYVSVNKSLGKKWETQLGLRMEATQSESKSNTLNFSQKNDYLKLFPTFYLSFNPNENNTVAFSYSKRISRPQFFDLNPNIYFVNPFQTIEGNPFLQPSFVDNFELSHTYKNLSTKVYYSNEEDLFAQVPLPDASTNIIQFTNENYINTRRYGFTTSYMFNKLKWWTSNNSLDINYSISEFTLEIPQEDLKGLNSRISTNNNFTLNEERTLLFGLNYWYSFPGNDGIFETESTSSLSASFQYLILDKNLRFTLRGNDIFRTQATRQSTTINSVFQEARYYYDSQSLFLSVSYKFGNKNISAKRHRTGNQDERNRTGN